MRKLVIAGIVLVAGGVYGLIVAHHYHPSPTGYFVRGVPGAPTRLSKTSYGLIMAVAGAVILVGIGIFAFALVRISRGGSFGHHDAGT